METVISANGNVRFGLKVKQAILDFIRLYGRDSPDYDPDSYVVTDFDNTTCIFDIQDQCLVYQLETMAFALGPGEFGGMLRANLDGNFEPMVSDIEKAYIWLFEKYGPFTPRGVDEGTRNIIVKEPMWMEFASKMMAMVGTAATYVDNWKVQWLAGMTADEIYDMAFRSCSKYSKMETHRQTIAGPDSVKSNAGPVAVSVTNGLTVVPETKELWTMLRDGGFDIWVCSASEINQVRAAIDFFGLHDLLTGATGKTMKFGPDGKMLPYYDYETGRGWLPVKGGWKQDIYNAKGSCREEGKVTTITNAIAVRYGGKKPLAGFMDSTGDFNFCTEFRNMKLAVCINRGDRKATDGGSLIAVAAVYENNFLGYDCLETANRAGDIYYVLQGRDENGLRSWRDDYLTVVFGDDRARLFADEDVEEILAYMQEHSMTLSEAFAKFSIATPEDSAENPLGFKFGFLDVYKGYRTVV